MVLKKELTSLQRITQLKITIKEYQTYVNRNVIKDLKKQLKDLEKQVKNQTFKFKPLENAD